MIRTLTNLPCSVHWFLSLLLAVRRSIDRSIDSTSLDLVGFSRPSSWTVREKRRSHPSPIITRLPISMSLLKGIASCGDLRHAASWREDRWRCTISPTVLLSTQPTCYDLLQHGRTVSQRKTCTRETRRLYPKLSLLQFLLFSNWRICKYY